MSKRIFVSFNFKNIDFRNDLAAFFQPLGGPVQATPNWVRNDVSRQGSEEIQREIRRAMEGCRGLVVVVGDDVHNSPWIRYELGLANGLHLPKVAIRHPRASGGLPPQHGGMTLLPWDPHRLAEEVRDW